MPARVESTAGAPTVAPLSLVVGEEELMVERAVARLITAARDAAGAAVQETSGADLAPGQLAVLSAPSLFSSASVLVVRNAQDAGKEVADELAKLAAAQTPDLTLIVAHAGGVKGKALLSALTKLRPAITECPKITKQGDRLAFIKGEFRRHGRAVDEGGARALLDALGSDLREIAAACSQLSADTTGPVGREVVARYYRGRAEASSFSVADRVVEGRLGEAVEMLRWALAIGVAPVLITSALAQSLRLLGRVGGAPRGRSDAALAAEVGAPPWKIDVVRRQLRGWSPEGIAKALSAVAKADAGVKGESASPGYALEAAIRTVVACRTAR